MCMLTNFVMCIPLADKSADKVVSAYLKTYIVDAEEVEKILSDKGSELKNMLFSKGATQLGIKHMYKSVYKLQAY